MRDNISFIFSSKANTLAALSAYKDLHIPQLFSFTVGEWRNDPLTLVKRIGEIFKSRDMLAARSSCGREDFSESSGAGAFLSRLNISSHDGAALQKAIDEVIASYGHAAEDDQVLIQSMIENPAVTGVIMTRSLADGSPYYVINYDDDSGRTDRITGGKHTGKTVFAHRTARQEYFESPRLASFVALARNLERICGTDLLDIEFCLDKDDILHLLQARPICAQDNWPESLPDSRIEQVAEFVAIKTGPAPGLFGRRSILGVMPDWNPAEMIGILPRPLATSLYRTLITSRVWAKARERMGYRPVAARELMPAIFGRPYIDVRASFNSFLPAGLDETACGALVDAWLDRLEAMPHLHDKVEFEIAQTAMDFTFDQDLEARYPGLLDAKLKSAFREKLTILTSSALNPDGTLASALAAVHMLQNRQAKRPLPDDAHPAPPSFIAPLLAECRKYGTLPFSILARHAFIAESMLRSAARRDAISRERLDEFKLSVRTISGEMSAQFRAVCEGRGNPQNFMRQYGHLRPGCYDILSPRYVDRTNLFGSGEIPAMRASALPQFHLTGEERKSLELLIRESGLETGPDALFEYARRAIAGREFAKFIFNRNLSDILEILAHMGMNFGFDRDDISFVDIQSFLDWRENAWPESPREYFGRRVEYNRELFSRAAGLKLGYLIRSVHDVYIAPQHRSAPNFIGQREVEAPVICLEAISSCDHDLHGKIVCIENADPGFDWIFTRGIAGLITCFGGANSHMAIRCAEYGLPAAIGVGERLFRMAANARSVYIHPAAAILKTQ